MFATTRGKGEFLPAPLLPLPAEAVPRHLLDSSSHVHPSAWQIPGDTEISFNQINWDRAAY